MIGNISKAQQFSPTAHYILKKDGAQLLSSNVPGAMTSPPAVVASEMERTAALNSRVKSPAYHLSISPAETESLSHSQWSQFGYRLLEQMNLEHHQFFIALHNDTHYPKSGQPRIHAHILVNLIDNTGHHCPTDWDYKRIQAALRKLEQEFNLDSPFLQPLPSPPTQTDSRGQQQRYERELREFQDPEHPRSQMPEQSHRQEIRHIIDDALETAYNWHDLTQQLNQNQISIKRSKRGWSVNFKDSHFAGYQLGKAYTLPSLLERLSVEQPNQSNPSTAVEQPVVQPSSTGLGNVLAETPIIEAEIISQTMKVQPKDVVQHIVDQIDQVDEHGRRTGVAKVIEDQSDSNMVDGTFLLGQFGQVAANALRLGAEFIPERNRSKLEATPITPTGSNKPSGAKEVDERRDTNGEVLEAVIVEPDRPQASPNSAQSEIDPEPNDQRLAHNLSSFIKVWTKANTLPIDTPFTTRSGDTVQLSGDQLMLSNDKATQAVIGANNKWISGPQQFEATRNSDGMWDVSINSLNQDTKERIAQLPTTPEAYQDYQNATAVVDHFRQQAQSANIPLNELTEFEWKANDGAFKHQFKLEAQPSNGSIHITGKDSENNDIFDVSLRADDTLAVRQASIDGNQIEQLRLLSDEREHSAERAHQQTNTQQLERTTSKGPQR